MTRTDKRLKLQGYVFHASSSRVVVHAQRRCDEEAKKISDIYITHYVATREGGVLLFGKWLWCGNPSCLKLIYSPECFLKKSDGKAFCSHECANKGRARAKMPQIAKLTEHREISSSPVEVSAAGSDDLEFSKKRKRVYKCYYCAELHEHLVSNCTKCKKPMRFISVSVPLIQAPT